MQGCWNWQTSRPQTPVFLTCGFKSRPLHQKKAHICLLTNVCFFQRNKSLAGFVKCTLCVKYASRVKCAAAREGIYFISHCDQRSNISQCAIAHYFTFGVSRIFHLKSEQVYDIIKAKRRCYYGRLEAS